VSGECVFCGFETESRNWGLDCVVCYGGMNNGMAVLYLFLRSSFSFLCKGKCRICHSSE
jgi:hypothetical protein